MPNMRRVWYWLLVLVLLLIALIRLAHVFGAGADFAVYYRAVELWWRGQNPYAVGVGFIYPPSFLAFFSWLAIMQLELAGRIFFLGSLAILVLTLYFFRKNLGVWWLPLLLLMANWFPVMNTLGMGQVNFWVLGYCLLAYYGAERGNTVKAGILLGVAAGIKVLPLLLLPYFWLTGKRKTVIAALMTFVILNFWQIGRYFSMMMSMGVIDQPYYFNQSLPALISRMGGSSNLWLVGIVLVYFLSLWRAKSARFSWYGYSLMLVTMTLISSTAWFHYFVFFLPAVIFLVGCKRWRYWWLWGVGLFLTGFVLKNPSLWQKSDLVYNHGAIGGIMIWLAMMLYRT